MQIMIDIPDEDYERISEFNDAFGSLQARAYKAIRHGTPLPPLSHNNTEDEPLLSKNDVLDAFGHGSVYTSDDIQRIVNGLPLVTK